ncbi:MAG: hypothetical protein Q8P93_02200 [bacterium]|nr:hypothetical protein [bacterium]
MQSRSRKLLFIDFDGTICRDKFWRSLDEEINRKIQKYLFQDNKDIVGDWMRGKYTSEEINQMVSEATGVVFEELWRAFEKDCKEMSVSQSILQKILDLRKGFYIILMTGNMDCFDRFTVPTLRLDNYFDSISNSYNEGKLKDDNNGELFVEYAKRHNADLRDAIVIDDSPRVCSTFINLGGKAFQVTPDKGAEYYLAELIDQI